MSSIAILIAGYALDAIALKQASAAAVRPHGEVLIVATKGLPADASVGRDLLYQGDVALCLGQWQNSVLKGRVLWFHHNIAKPCDVVKHVKNLFVENDASLEVRHVPWV